MLDGRSGEEFVTMVLATIISGGGATPQQDGWHAVGPECCFGALTSGDVELLEYSYPIIIHRYSLMTDSGGAGKFRGGSGTAWEVEPLNGDMMCIGFGEGRRIPAMGAAGAASKLIDTKVGRERVYAVNPVPLQSVAGWLEGYRAFWQASLMRLKRNLEEK